MTTRTARVSRTRTSSADVSRARPLLVDVDRVPQPVAALDAWADQLMGFVVRQDRTPRIATSLPSAG